MLTSKQENFCKAVALKEMTQYEAYTIAYPTSLDWERNSVDSKASQLMDNVKILQRVKELKLSLEAKTIEKLVITKMKLVEELEDIRKEAKDDKDRKIEIDCIKEQGKLEGLYIEQSKDLTKSEFKTWLKDRE